MKRDRYTGRISSDIQVMQFQDKKKKTKNPRAKDCWQTTRGKERFPS